MGKRGRGSEGNTEVAAVAASAVVVAGAAQPVKSGDAQLRVDLGLAAGADEQAVARRWCAFAAAAEASSEEDVVWLARALGALGDVARDALLDGADETALAALVTRLEGALCAAAARGQAELEAVAGGVLGCLARLAARPDLRALRAGVGRLASFRLWKLVSPRRLAAHLRSSDAVAQQWQTLLAKEDPATASSGTGKELAALACFWSAALQSALCSPLHGRAFLASAAVGAAVSWVAELLRGPQTSRFVALLLEDTSFCARCRARAQAPARGDSAIDEAAAALCEAELCEVETLLVCGDLSEEMVRRRHVARVRLLMRVGLRHFEAETKEAVLAPADRCATLAASGELDRALSADGARALAARLGLLRGAQPSSPMAWLDELDAAERASEEGADAGEGAVVARQLLRTAHAPLPGFEGRLEALRASADDAFFDVLGLARAMGGDGAATAQTLGFCEEMLRRKLCSPARRARAQYRSEAAMLDSECSRLKEQHLLGVCVDIAAALARLAASAQNGAVALPGWSRMALPATLTAGSTLVASLRASPAPVVAEWAALQAQRAPVLVVQVASSAGAVQVRAVFAAVVTAVEPSLGRFSLRWLSSHRPVAPLPDGARLLLVRRTGGERADRPRRMARLLLGRTAQAAQEDARGVRHLLLPRAPRAALLGLGAAGSALAALVETPPLPTTTTTTTASPTTHDENLEHGQIRPLSDAVLAAVNESLAGQRVLIVCEQPACAHWAVEQLLNETALPACRAEPAALVARAHALALRREELLQQAAEIAAGLGVRVEGAALDCAKAQALLQLFVRPELERYAADADASSGAGTVKFPFAFFFGGRDDGVGNRRACSAVRALFDELDELRLLEVLPSDRARGEWVLRRHSRAVVATLDDLATGALAGMPVGHEDQPAAPLAVDRVVVLQAARVGWAEALLAFASCDASARSVLCVGDSAAGFVPGKVDQLSLLDRVRRLTGDSAKSAPEPPAAKPWPAPQPELRPALGKVLTRLGTARGALLSQAVAPRGLACAAQFVHVRGHELSPAPGEVQNVVEAEFLVATFHFLALCGVPPHHVVVLTPFAAQKLLLLDVLVARSANGRLPMPGAVATFEEAAAWGAAPHAIALVSLARTASRGESDPRRAAAAVLAADQGLVVFGCRDVWCEDPVWGALAQARPESRLELRIDHLLPPSHKPAPPATMQVEGPEAMASALAHVLLWEQGRAHA